MEIQRESSTSSESPKFIGVRKRKWGKYVSEIRLPNSRERIWLGSYDTAVKAARAFDAAQFCLRGKSGRFNFPHDPPEIPGGESMTPAEIQAAAARFANSVSSVSEESLQPSNFEMTDLPMEDAFMNLNAGMEENYYAHEFGLFSGYGEFAAGDFTVPAPSYGDYWPESHEETVFSEASSFLWNF